MGGVRCVIVVDRCLPRVATVASPNVARAEREIFVPATVQLTMGGCHHADVPCSILLVDDHEEFRRAARAMLEASGFHVTGEAGDAAEALSEVGRLRPDIVLVDIQLPDLDGFTLAEQIAASTAPPVVVLISSRDAVVYGTRLATTPARGFIAKSDLSGATLATLLS